MKVFNKNKIIKRCFIIILFVIILIIKILTGETITIQKETGAFDKVYNSNTTEQTELTDIHKALQEVAYSYYMRGENIQYNSMKGNPSWYSPEEATSQNTNYIVCSAFTKNVYYELLGIKIPPYTKDLIEYGKNHIGKSEVIGYGCKAENNFVMKFYDKKYDNNYKEIINPTLQEVIPYLQIRRCNYIYWTCNASI